jgi:electron transfer flavoprotein alpha subunit
MSKVIILIDHEEGAIRPHSFELASAAALLFPDGQCSVTGLIAGQDIVPAAEKFAGATGIGVLAVESATLRRYTAEGYLAVLAHITPPLLPSVILAAHNSVGCDIAPALAAALDLPLVTGVEEIRASREGWNLRRTAWHGKAVEAVSLPAGAAVFTVMPGAFRSPENITGARGKVTVRKSPVTLSLSSDPHALPAGPDNAALAGAEVVVSAGRGVRTPEHMAHIHALAGLFPRSAVGGSRLACDMGLVDYGAQVGMTGRTVSPKLYIACGISGAAQHLAGMKGSRHIVAVNSDAHAPIFRVADFGIVDELEKFIPALIGAAERHRVKS